MEINEYHRLARRTSNGQRLENLDRADNDVLRYALGAAAKLGGVVDRIKKYYHQGHKEADTYALWYALDGFFERGATPPPISSLVREMTYPQTLLCNAVLGLVGETSELAELVEKALFQHDSNREALFYELHGKMIAELGDVCWYIAAACTALDVDLETVMQHNVDKLRTRYPDGFSSEASQARIDTNGLGLMGEAGELAEEQPEVSKMFG